MAAELSGCCKSIIGDDQDEIDTHGRRPKDVLCEGPSLLDDIIPIYSFLPVAALVDSVDVLDFLLHLPALAFGDQSVPWEYTTKGWCVGGGILTIFFC